MGTFSVVLSEPLDESPEAYVRVWHLEEVRLQTSLRASESDSRSSSSCSLCPVLLRVQVLSYEPVCGSTAEAMGRATLAETGGVRPPSAWALFCSYVAREGLTDDRAARFRIRGKRMLRNKAAMSVKWTLGFKI